MKLTKKMLRKMILEEANVLRAEKRQKLSEYGSGGLKNPGDYAIGAYFDVNMMKQFNQLMYDMFENAMAAAKEDMGDAQDAYDEVMAAFETLIEEAQMDMRY